MSRKVGISVGVIRQIFTKTDILLICSFTFPQKAVLGIFDLVDDRINSSKIIISGVAEFLGVK